MTDYDIKHYILLDDNNKELGKYCTYSGAESNWRSYQDQNTKCHIEKITYYNGKRVSPGDLDY